MIFFYFSQKNNHTLKPSFAFFFLYFLTSNVLRVSLDISNHSLFLLSLELFLSYLLFLFHLHWADINVGDESFPDQLISFLLDALDPNCWWELAGPTSTRHRSLLLAKLNWWSRERPVAFCNPPAKILPSNNRLLLIIYLFILHILKGILII